MEIPRSEVKVASGTRFVFNHTELPGVRQLLFNVWRTVHRTFLSFRESVEVDGARGWNQLRHGTSTVAEMADLATIVDSQTSAVDVAIGSTLSESRRKSRGNHVLSPALHSNTLTVTVHRFELLQPDGTGTGGAGVFFSLLEAVVVRSFTRC